MRKQRAAAAEDAEFEYWAEQQEMRAGLRDGGYNITAMPKKTANPSFKFVNLSSGKLTIEPSDRRGPDVSIPLQLKANGPMPPMWKAIYFKFMYPEVYKRNAKTISEARKRGATTRYSLGPPPAWLVVVGATMWQGIIQGASWEFVKTAVAAALSRLSLAGLGPTETGSKTKSTSVHAGWREYSKPGRKQYEMYLSLRRTIKQLPERHAVAYARAKDATDFGRIIRDEQPPRAATKKQPPAQAAAKRRG